MPQRKEINIGGEPVAFGASGALPIFYREETGRDIFADMQSMTTTVSDKVLDLIWVMYREANPDDCTNEREWLMNFSYADINTALPEIFELLAETQKTLSVPKKKKGR